MHCSGGYHQSPILHTIIFRVQNSFEPQIFCFPQIKIINLRASSVFLNKVFLLTVNEHYWVQSNLLFMSYLSGVSGIRVEQTAPRIQVRATAIQPGAEQYIHLDSMYTLRTSTCCLLCWTGLNQFMGRLGRATCTIHSRRAVPGKAGKAVALPRFWKIQGGGGSGGAPPL